MSTDHPEGVLQFRPRWSPVRLGGHLVRLPVAPRVTMKPSLSRRFMKEACAPQSGCSSNRREGFQASLQVRITAKSFIASIVRFRLNNPTVSVAIETRQDQERHCSWNVTRTNFSPTGMAIGGGNGVSFLIPLRALSSGFLRVPRNPARTRSRGNPAGPLMPAPQPCPARAPAQGAHGEV